MIAMSLDFYVRSFKGEKVLPFNFDGYYGRVLRGTNPEDFLTLSDDKERILVFVLNESGLMNIVGNETIEILLKLGYKSEYINSLLEKNTKFKLIIFPKSSDEILATWDNVLDRVLFSYPNTHKLVHKYKEDLQLVPFYEIEKQAGFSFSEVELRGLNDSRYMTYSRLDLSNASLIDFRAFLYYNLHLKEYFTGNGYTINHSGQCCLDEFIIQNRQICSLKDYKIINLSIWLKKGEKEKVLYFYTRLSLFF